MKRYLGSKITMFAAIGLPLFAIAAVVFIGIALVSQISVATIFISMMCFLCVVLIFAYVKQIENQLYSWGVFGRKDVRINTGLTKKYMIVYAKCRCCGIAYYTHGIFNSKAGTKVFYIFLSEGFFDERFRASINLWKPSQTRIKIEFDKRLYDYLLAVLPRKQAIMLESDYQKYLLNH